MEITHVKKSFSMSTLGLLGKTPVEDKGNFRQLRLDVLDVIKREAKKVDSMLVVTYKGLRDILSPLVPNNVKLEHFGALRGIDRHKGVDLLMQVGRLMPSPAAAREIARALYGEAAIDNEELTESVVSMIMNDETEQAIDRGRYVGNLKPRRVLLCSDHVPSELRIDKEITWPQLKGTWNNGSDIVEKLVKRFGGIPNVATAYRYADDILNVSSLDAAKKIYKRHVTKSLGGQSLIRIYIRVCPLKKGQDKAIRKPYLLVEPDYQPDVAESKLSSLGLSLISDKPAAQAQPEQPSSEHAETRKSAGESTDCNGVQNGANLAKPTKALNGSVAEASNCTPTGDQKGTNSVNTEQDENTKSDREIPTLAEVMLEQSRPEELRSDFLMLAEAYNADVMHEDMQMISSLMQPLKLSDRKRLLAGYLKQFNQQKICETEAHAKQNSGRFAANCWLREQCAGL